MYQLKYRKQARNYLARLPLQIKTIIIDKLHQIAADPDLVRPDIKSLKGRVGYRLRIGQYRVIYTRHDEYLVIEIVKIRSRGDIYKG
jgi:mRNA interferase RelE/StbE